MSWMSRPCLAAIGFTASKIWACGPGVTPILMVSAEAPADHATRTAERIRGRRNDILVSITQRQRLEPYSLLYVAKSMKWKSKLDAGSGRHLLNSISIGKRIRRE